MRLVRKKLGSLSVEVRLNAPVDSDFEQVVRIGTTVETKKQNEVGVSKPDETLVPSVDSNANQAGDFIIAPASNHEIVTAVQQKVVGYLKGLLTKALVNLD